MKRFLFACCVAVTGNGLQASSVSAQSNCCCCCGTVATVSVVSPATPTSLGYQRFSYEPAASMPAQSTGSIVQLQPSFVQSDGLVQSYRRYSYQPTASNRYSANGHRTELWEYTKGDSRKQQH